MSLPISLLFPDIVERNVKLYRVIGEGFGRFTEIGNAADPGNPVAYRLLWEANRLGCFILRVAAHPHIEVALIASD